MMKQLHSRGERGERGMDINTITEKIIGGAIKVHSQLGPGLLESIYEKCLGLELAKAGLRFECQAPVDVIYDGVKVGHAYFIDILVERVVVVEIKAVERLNPVYTAQLISYLKLSGCQVGLMLNFNSYNLRAGIKRVVLDYRGPAPRSSRSQRP
ncbi:MAG TPA: GxxExxY protein [Longimicrobiales bacterium]